MRLISAKTRRRLNSDWIHSDRGRAGFSHPTSCHGSVDCTAMSIFQNSRLKQISTWCLCVKPAHLRAAQEVVELDPADGGVGLEVGEFVSQQKSRHGRLFSAAQTREEGRRGRSACLARCDQHNMNGSGWGRGYLQLRSSVTNQRRVVKRAFLKQLY